MRGGAAAVFLALLGAGCPGAPEDDILPLTVTSPAFQKGEPIPARFTCEGDDLSPALRISGVPPAAKALALVMDDPDAPRGLWTHWTAWDLPPGLSEVPEGFRPASQGGVEGKTSAGATGYHGPCPPSGTHRYFFHVYALDGRLGLASGSDRAALDRAMRGHVVAEGSVMGTFAR